MNLRVKYTKHQVARGARADGEDHSFLYLIKNVSMLRLTYQIRLLTFRAFDTRRKLIIRIPEASKVHSTLHEFQKQHSKVIRIERY